MYTFPPVNPSLILKLYKNICFKDEDGNPLETEYGLSKFKDHQTFTIQVTPAEVVEWFIKRILKLHAVFLVIDIVMFLYCLTDLRV